MSTNCIKCVTNKRTGPDLLCDECRTSESSTSPDSLELARKAINHVLKQIRNNPDIRYHMGAFTESFELVKAAHSAMNGISEGDIEEDTFVALKRKSAAERMDEIKGVVDRLDTRLDPELPEAIALKQIVLLCRA